ncbi:DUF7151 family protein [Tenacibaculum amylolyticum]|uniref:DUF7151 family protein n=1 Tax=Tenacibaculum amylolyticum TaxID=104269 RepID=UPI003895D648
MKQGKTKKTIYCIISLFLIGCQGEDGVAGPAGENGLSSLVNITNVPAGENCENGGIKLDVGIDNNSDGLLEMNEVQTTSYICNGLNGSNSLTSVITELAGENCENGGVKINLGIDTNSDGILNESEITSTSYVCNGAPGDSSLTKITNESAGSVCEAGGIKIESGVDVNSNSELENEEVTSTQFICNGLNGDSYKETRLLIYHGAINGSYSGTSSTSRLKLGELIRFDKRDWENASSISYTAVAKTSRSDNNFIFELYNETDNELIQESRITSNNVTFEMLESANIINNLPEREITLALYIRSENDGVSVGFNGKSELIIEN